MRTKPNFMKFNLHLTLFSILSLAFVFGCGSDTEVNFLLNELPFESVDGKTPFEQIDSTSIYDIYAGDTVVFKDISKPEKDERIRFWNLDGQEGWESQDERLTTYVYETVGNFKVVLCIDGMDKCAAKAITVKERPYVPPVTVPTIAENPPPKKETPRTPTTVKKPEVKFLLPNVYSTNTNKDEFNVKARVGRVSDKSGITLEINGQRMNGFSISKGVLYSKVPLKEGKNSLKLTAENSGGSDSQEIEFIYHPEGPAASPIVGFIQPSTSTASTSNDKYEVVVATANVTKKEQISMSVDGKSFKEFSFSTGTGEVKAKIPLKKGENRIRVTAGSATSEVNITLESGGGVAWTGVQTKDINTSTCDEYTVTSGTVTLTPKRNLRLMECTVFSSECGSISFKLAGAGERLSETKELSKSKSQLVFDVLDGIELEADTPYTLSFSTSKSSDCPSGSPKLLNASSCGKNSSGDQILEVGYGGSASLFRIKYQY